MQLQVLDTNIILRFLVHDHPGHFTQAEKIFKEGEEGKRELVLLAPVIAEVAYVLQSFYKHKQSDIAHQLQVLVSQRWVAVDERDVIIVTLDLYGKGMHFIDAYLHAWAHYHEAKILTFDKRLEKKK